MILIIDKNSLFKYFKKELKECSKCDKRGLHVI